MSLRSKPLKEFSAGESILRCGTPLGAQVGLAASILLFGPKLRNGAHDR
jgi:hypothetical protein